MQYELEKFLEQLENQIDPLFEDQKLQNWKDHLDNKQFFPFFGYEIGQDTNIDWPTININDAFESFELMVLSELRQCYKCAKQRLSQIMNVRPNYGTGILPSLFGAELFMMDREINTLSSVRHIGKDKIKKALNSGDVDLMSGLGSRVFEFSQLFIDKTKHYPKINKYIRLYHPDIQGPIDACELLWGSELFLGFYDEPRLIDEFLNLITQTYIKFMNKWYAMVLVKDNKYSSHWGYLQKGKVLLRNDSLMNLSPNIYNKLIVKYDQAILTEFSGGIHFCGKADHCIDEMFSLDNLTWIHISQPEYNNMNMIFEKALQKQIPIAVGAKPGVYSINVEQGISFHV